MGEPLDATKVREAVSEPGLADLAGIDVDAVVMKILASRTDDQLLAAVEWYSLDGVVAYKLLATQRFQLVSDYIRTDVSQGFRRLKEAADDNFRKSMGPAAEKLIQRWSGDLNKFIAARFLEAAAQGIAAHAVSTDIALARQWLLPKKYRRTKLH